MAEEEVKTNFVSKSTNNEVFLGKGLTLEHFLRCMTYFNFAVTEWTGQGKKCIDPAKPEYDKIDPIDPPLVLPMNFWIEGAIPETIFFAPYSTLTNTWGWKYLMAREGFAVSETSHLYGQYVGQREAARRNLREIFGSLSAIRHSVLNLKSDQERLAEQVKAFKSKSEEQIKGIFVDNYGGQGRTWNELSRNVQVCKAALSWFFKIEAKDKDEAVEKIDKEVKDEALNPVVANYLKRKFEEYFVWKDEYKDWLFTTHDKITDMIQEQDASEQLYMKWAKDNLIAGKRLELDFDTVVSDLGSAEFPRFAAKAAYLTEFFFWFAGAPFQQLMHPWHPCIAIQMSIFYNPDLQGWKFTRSVMHHYYGVIHKNDVDKLQAWYNLDITEKDLHKMMILHSDISLDKMRELLEEKEAKRAKEKEKIEKKAGSKDVEKEAANMFSDLGDGMRDLYKAFGDTFLLPWGVDVYKRAESKRMRAEAYVHKWYMTYYNMMKKDFGMPSTE